MPDTNLLHSFPPIVDESCTLLILGSMPGAESLRQNRYYAYKQNNFWRIIFDVFGEKYMEEYDQKIRFVLQRHIALWDVLKYCEREGSSDSKIRNPVVNDFKWLLTQYSGIKFIYFNGEKAESLFMKYKPLENGQKDIEFHRLPSTSPANTMPFQDKLAHWKTILQGLEEV